jgi:hypothetical protein
MRFRPKERERGVGMMIPSNEDPSFITGFRPTAVRGTR